MSVAQQISYESNFTHLFAICDARGLFEHCDLKQPRRDHGYCVDDVARALIVLERERSDDRRISHLIDVLAGFMAAAQQSDGQVINRCDVDGVWHGRPSTDDHWGRALWCWGSMVALDPKPERVRDAYERFAKSAALRSHHPRAMVFAGLGAIHFLKAYPENPHARALLNDALLRIPSNVVREQAWPEARLTYANAALPELLIRGGHFLGEDEVVQRGLSMLRWLLTLQTIGGHLSLIPASGWAVGEVLPGFDQQSIEVAALIDACAGAWEVTRDESWLSAIDLGRRWFEGSNDSSARMYDPDTGAGFDGLTPTGVNLNCGAESTLAYLSVMQQVHRIER